MNDYILDKMLENAEMKLEMNETYNLVTALRELKDTKKIYGALVNFIVRDPIVWLQVTLHEPEIKNLLEVHHGKWQEHRALVKKARDANAEPVKILP